MMLERATKQPKWLDQLLPGGALDQSLGTANEFRRSELAEPALRDLLQGWLSPPTPLLLEDRELYHGLVFHWNAEAEEISAEVLPAFQRHFTALVSGDAKGHLQRAFATKTLLRIDERVGRIDEGVSELREKQVSRDELAAIVREAVQSALPPPSDHPQLADELPPTLVVWAKRKGLTLDEVRQELAAWERELEQAVREGEPGATAEQALAAYARRELDRAAGLAEAQALAAENELLVAEKQLVELEETRRSKRRQAWESRLLQARALYDQWRFGEALTSYRSALEVRTRADLPQDRAMTQNNLANALQNQGIRTAGEAGAGLLAEAVAAYRSALEVYTRADLPQHWATTQNNLGIALQEQGIRTAGEAGAGLLAEAVAAYRSALEVRTRADLPQDWAMTQNNLANALQNQGIRTAGEAGAGLLAEAVAACRSALEVYTRETAPYYHAHVQRNLNVALQSGESSVT